MLDMDKPHRGTIEQWGPLGLDATSLIGCEIVGMMGERDIMTSRVRGQDANEIETLNNRYTLGERYVAPAKTLDGSKKPL